MSESATSGANAPEFSVSELSSALKRAIEDRFGYVRVRGEISGYRGPHSSGHVYFSLKDANARLDAVIWKGVFGRMRVKPEEGLEVVVTGKITTFPGKSAYQIIVESLEPAGVGALMALLEARRRKIGRGGPVRRRAQAIAALSAARHRRRHLADGRGDPRHPASPLRSLSRPRAGVAGARAGGDLGGGGRAGDPRLQRAARRTARFRGPTFSSSRAAAARSRTSGASTRKSSCAPRRRAKSR